MKPKDFKIGDIIEIIRKPGCWNSGVIATNNYIHKVKYVYI